MKKILIKTVDYIDKNEELKTAIEIIEEVVVIALLGVVVTAFGMALAVLGGV